MKEKKKVCIEEMQSLILRISELLGDKIDEKSFSVVDRGIPHVPAKLPKSKTAVYVFYCPKENCFLKIGKVGENSNPRFFSQHYNPHSAGSNLAKSLLKDAEIAQKYNLTEKNVGDWIKTNTQRVDILFDAKINRFANELAEAILHYKYLPKYEG